ncbi:MAG: tRNA (uridine(34)/cytosine(34)/5-carboxymethylaminomethyluridine(34)-2'-O)-methyltransferase TrmL [Deltaproteobacteria bacterium RIFOXYD12_FULL_57_12]|nr:MAG: tRNA (uridine(34)/cytosine(34)/5-carboxymethylaminomethyluridine(34)-2'-O)-methyltransferase TrmL [Deltaproteobacteria bacterium RIFOXYD12_FULL_57_12]
MHKEGYNFNIVLVEPEIPPNTGTIARLCGATESTLHLIKPLGFSTDDRHLKRAGLDYWHHVKIIYWDNVNDFLEQHDRTRLHFLSKKVARPYTDARFSPTDFLIFGKETKGLPEKILNEYDDRCYTIPMMNTNIRSLNLAVSAGIVLYEAIRQQLCGDGHPQDIPA